MSKTLSFQLPDEMLQDLDSMCQDMKCSRSYIIKRIIEKYLHEFADYHIALERLMEKEDKSISCKNFKQTLSL